LERTEVGGFLRRLVQIGDTESSGIEQRQQQGDAETYRIARRRFFGRRYVKNGMMTFDLPQDCSSGRFLKRQYQTAISSLVISGAAATR
jgi:hypothetical protein